MRKKLLIVFLALIFSFLIVGCDNKPSYDLSGIKFEDKIEIYDGTPKHIYIEGALPEGVSVSYEGNGKIEPGAYQIKAIFKGASSYKAIPSLTATLTIKPVQDVKLPDLDRKDEAEIKSELSKLGFNNVVIEEIFNITKFRNNFVGYKDFKVDQIVNTQEEITVLVATRKLPDVTKIYTENLKQFFLNAGVREDNIIGMADNTVDPEFGHGYYGDLKAGDEYVSGSRIVYIYNSAQIKLRDLSGYTRPQIDAYLNQMDLTANFHQVVDNTKEMGTFNMYVGVVIGQVLDRNSRIDIILYENDDIHDEKQLFISKHVDVEAGSNGLELFNPTTKAIDLANYYVSIFENGSIYETYRVELEGSLASGETYFIASSTSNDDLKSKAQLVSSKLIFDGNDTIQLRKKSNNTYIDTVYNIGNTAFTMDDEIFVRRDRITKGNRDFDNYEWAGYIPSYTEIIGNHPHIIEEFPPFELLEPTFQEFGMTKVRYKSAADGDTVYFESLDPRDTTPYDGNSRVRFIMVNTPETEKPGQEGQPYAEEASKFTRDKLSNAVEIYIQADRQAGLTENYGRHLGLVWYNSGTIENPVWRLLNHELAYYGLGFPGGIKDLGGAYKNSSVWGHRYLYQWSQDADIHAKTNKLGIHSGVYKP